MMSPNSSGEVSRPCARTEYVYSWPLGARRAAHLAGGIHGVLRLNGGDHFGDGDAELRELVGLDPQPHRVLARAEYLHVADAGDARQLVVQIDVGIIGEKFSVVGALRRKEPHHHERRGDGFLHGDAEVGDVLRKLRGRLRFAHLGEHQIGVGIGLHVEVDDHGHLPVARGVERVHVVQVVDAAHLLLDGRGDGLLDGLRVGADIVRANLHFRRRDRRELRDGQVARWSTAPMITIRMEITIATMGRLMKNFDITSLPCGVLRIHGAPGGS